MTVYEIALIFYGYWMMASGLAMILYGTNEDHRGE